jgi:catechol 2,3-dioxygenase-like lactoylglutathione lyase family enzyme
VLHYATLNVSDLARSGSFYDAVVAPLGWRRQEDSAEAIAWGLTRPEFYVTSSESPRPGFGLISLPAKSIPAVKASFESGVENGGEPVDQPGSAPLRGPGNYAARIQDPDGYLIEICVSNE